MISRALVQAAIDRVRPYMRADGGDVELMDIVGNKAMVRLLGNCAGCPSAHLTLYLGLEQSIREAVPELDEVVVV